ncbi:MAG: hypothetical protein JNN01_05790 [Opitutaceae bacterium]|nr:hypothetical protein [Opitutaceae bacterium]
MSFRSLFRLSSHSDDGLTQSEREAIVDVLHYCMFADKHIATTEDDLIEAAARTFNWDPKVSYEYYEGKSTGMVRAALADAYSRVTFLTDLNSRLGNQAKLIALQLAERVINADGVRRTEELEAMEALRKALSLTPGQR